jgi:RNA polymerase sigma-70 factor (ECF subfamily)
VNALPLPRFLSRTSSPDADFVALVRAELPRVERLLGRMLGPRGDLEDLVQQVFVEALRSARYRGEGSPGAFIGGIAVHVAKRAMRGSAFSRRRADLLAEPVASTGCPETAYARAAQMEALRSALARLTPKKRVAFTLWALEGLKVAEIAALTGESAPAIRSQIFYAQKELRAFAERSPALREALGVEP